MKKKSICTLLIIPIFFILTGIATGAGDWPIFKGNIYFTGNNDEIIVKNNNLKWLFQAHNAVFNPIVSDGRIYFIDLGANLYCLDEEYGDLIWKIRFRDISKQFKALSRAAGKIKYPLIKGNLIFLTDPIAVYAINKYTGKVVWARTGMRMETGKTNRFTRYNTTVESIYSDPVIIGNNILYGTRSMFISREIMNGHLNWDNRKIHSFSGFPTFYDQYIFTQSMDHARGTYKIHCLKSASGKEVWAADIPKPMKIFPPVIYKKNVYVPSNKSIYCLDLKTGRRNWEKEYGNYITSNPGFTDRAILFTIGNNSIIVINPGTGDIISEIGVGERSSPAFVTIRNQIYIASNKFKTIKKKPISFGIVKALNFNSRKVLWEYTTPFPGGVSQPVSSKGILFLPAGNYLYAIGTEYYKRTVDGGEGYAIVPGKKDPGRRKDRFNKKAPGTGTTKKIPTRKITITVNDEHKSALTTDVVITKRKKGKIIYQKRRQVNGKSEIRVPDDDNVEILVSKGGYIPKKVIVNRKDKEKKITLEKLKKGKGFVVDNLNFEHGEAYLRKGSLDILDRLVALMKRNPGLKVEIRGHTDSVGKDAFNQKLSERRADSVAEYLIKHGISPEQLNSVGHGEKKPIASNDTEAGRSKNRRTEFYIRE